MSEAEKSIRLMKPFLPPIEEALPYFEKIWNSRWVTNGGSIHDKFEAALRQYLGIDHISLFTNGTLALTLALKALDLKGEVITTPFTSVSTLQAMHWNNLRPVFVDIDERDLNIDVNLIEAAITTQTCAIVPVHIFGHPCDIDSIDTLATRHGIKVVYDAAHCFGVDFRGRSVFAYGDLAVASFHATKVFSSIEGGAVFCRDHKMKELLDALKNSGLHDEYRLAGYGLNAKMNEFQAAIGLVNLKYVEQVIQARKRAYQTYEKSLKNIEGLSLVPQRHETRYNYAYLPVLIDPEVFGASREEVMNTFISNNIHVKKYFHPLVSDYPEFAHFKTFDLPVAKKVSESVLCLPLYHDIEEGQIQQVLWTIKSLKL